MNDKVCAIYQDDTEKSRYLLISHFEIPAERAVELAKLVLSSVSVDNVVIFDTILDWKFNATAPEPAAPPLLRKLETPASREESESKPTDSCPFLESPNLLDSFAAALLTQRLLRRQTGRIYASLESSRLLTVDTILAFEAGLKSVTQKNTGSTTLDVYKKMLASLESRRPNPLFL